MYASITVRTCSGVGIRSSLSRCACRPGIVRGAGFTRRAQTSTTNSTFVCLADPTPGTHASLARRVPSRAHAGELERAVDAVQRGRLTEQRQALVAERQFAACAVQRR